MYNTEIADMYAKQVEKDLIGGRKLVYEPNNPLVVADRNEFVKPDRYQ